MGEVKEQKEWNRNFYVSRDGKVYHSSKKELIVDVARNYKVKNYENGILIYCGYEQGFPADYEEYNFCHNDGSICYFVKPTIDEISGRHTITTKPLKVEAKVFDTCFCVQYGTNEKNYKVTAFDFKTKKWRNFKNLDALKMSYNGISAN